jgi:hypothetical protein
MLEKAVRICEAKFGMLFLHEDGGLRLMAAHDVPPAYGRLGEEGRTNPRPVACLTCR